MAEEIMGVWKEMGKLFVDSYCNGKVALAMPVLEGIGPNGFHRLFFLNEKCKGMINSEEIKDVINQEADFYIFYKEKEFDTKAILETIDDLFGIIDREYTVCEYKYNSSVEIANFNFSENSGYDYCFGIESDPAFVYCAITPEKLRRLSSGSSLWNITMMNILYHFSEKELSKLPEQYGFKSIKTTSILEECNKYRMIFIRAVSLNSVLSIIILIVTLTMIITIVRLEFSMEARKLTLKRILGYSYLKSNFLIIIINSINTAISVAVVLLLNLILHASNWNDIIICGFLLIIVEQIIIQGCIKRLIKKSAASILKGGCL